MIYTTTIDFVNVMHAENIIWDIHDIEKNFVNPVVNLF